MLYGDSKVIQPGDLLHCDVGLKYLRLITDHQEMAYVLRPGETDAPQGLQDGIAEAIRLQDVFVSCWSEGATGNEILHRALMNAKMGSPAQDLLALAQPLLARTRTTYGPAVGAGEHRWSR